MEQVDIPELEPRKIYEVQNLPENYFILIQITSVTYLDFTPANRLSVHYLCLCVNLEQDLRKDHLYLIKDKGVYGVLMYPIDKWYKRLEVKEVPLNYLPLYIGRDNLFYSKHFDNLLKGEPDVQKF